jgi:3-oxoacyl-[acyl-carrier-protein] synthase II
VDYVNAHATATTLGDVVESQATFAVLGGDVPVSGTKGHTGHTLGACGAIELAFCVGAMRQGFLPATRNLDEVDPACAPLDYILETRSARPRVVMNNNFAFGGINTSLILRAL